MSATIAPPASSPAATTLTLQPPHTCRDNADLLQDAENDLLVLEADELLMQERWSWVQELVENARDAHIRQEAKLFFLRLVRASTVGAMEAVMSDLDAWRTGLEAIGDSKRRLPRELKELARTLFLLGADKQLDLSRTAADAPAAIEP